MIKIKKTFHLPIQYTRLYQLEHKINTYKKSQQYNFLLLLSAISTQFLLYDTDTVQLRDMQTWTCSELIWNAFVSKCQRVCWMCLLLSWLSLFCCLLFFMWNKARASQHSLGIVILDLKKLKSSLDFYPQRNWCSQRWFCVIVTYIFWKRCMSSGLSLRAVTHNIYHDRAQWTFFYGCCSSPLYIYFQVH